MGLLGLAAAGLWYGSQRALYPSWYEHRRPEQGLRPNPEFGLDPRADLGLDYEEVEFPAVDGSTLRGWLVPGAKGAPVGVATVHGGGGDRRNFLPIVPFLHEAGYPVLLFDCREHGVSDGAGRGIGLAFRERHDVSSAVSFLKHERGLARVAVIGTSMGGASALLAAAADPSIDAVVAENPWTRVLDLARDTSLNDSQAPDAVLQLVRDAAVWRIGATGEPEPIDVVAAISPRPLLLMHGTADRIIPPAHSEQLYARAREPKALWLARDARHGMLFDRHPGEYRERLLAFLARWLGQPGATPNSSR
ncbi:MAG: alpha/beta fold hydrolase [Myxococcota bacterium]